MSLNVKLVAVIAFASLVNSHPTTSQPQLEKGQSEDVHKLPIEEQFPPRDSYLPYEPQLPLNFQLPKAEPNPVPFYAPEPIAFLKPPQEDRAPNYYQAPLPALDLEPPVETEWNPSNDPKLYYEVPSVLTKQELPTKVHPKKYNAEVHLKKKPYSLKPKHELVLEPIDEEQYEAKQKETQKAFQTLFKKENQKQLEAIKARQAIQV